MNFSRILLPVFFALLLSLQFACAAENSTGSADKNGTVTLAETNKPCFNCHGTGKGKCPASNCRKGEVDCPNTCMKLSQGAWHPMAGHPPNEMWQDFRGKDGIRSWSQAHVGQVFRMVNGNVENLGVCKTCNGTTKVKCPVCKGTGGAVCSICDGKKTVPASWSAFDNPKLKERPEKIQLKDGRTILGKVILKSDSVVWVRVENGDKVEINQSDIVPK